MSSGITIPSVTTFCKTYPNLLSINRAEQIKVLPSIIDAVFFNFTGIIHKCRCKTIHHYKILV